MSAKRLCEHCSEPLPFSARSHARFCSPAHRRAAHRARNPDPRRVRARFLAGRSHEKTVTAAYTAIVPDKRFPGMFRLKCADGTLSDLVNLSRAKDALRDLDESASRQPRKRPPPGQGDGPLSPPGPLLGDHNVRMDKARVRRNGNKDT
jgi:hypothetical protein